MVLAPVFLEFLIADFGVLVLHERQAEESLLGGHCFWWINSYDEEVMRFFDFQVLSF